MLGNIHFYVLRHGWLLCPTAHMACDRTTCVAGVFGIWFGTIMLCNEGRNHSRGRGRKWNFRKNTYLFRTVNLCFFEGFYVRNDNERAAEMVRRVPGVVKYLGGAIVAPWPRMLWFFVYSRNSQISQNWQISQNLQNSHTPQIGTFIEIYRI